LFRGKIQDKLEAAIDVKAMQIPGLPIVDPQPDWSDWMLQRELMHLYQTSLDSVVADKTLIEHLGEPIDTSVESEDLFRRRDKGPFNYDGEQIEFDVLGPKGKGKVVVLSTTEPSANITGAMPGASNDGLQPKKITVTLQDGTEVNVEPLYRPLPPVR
jgi:hypothetical protein